MIFINLLLSSVFTSDEEFPKKFEKTIDLRENRLGGDYSHLDLVQEKETFFLDFSRIGRVDPIKFIKTFNDIDYLNQFITRQNIAPIKKELTDDFLFEKDSPIGPNWSITPREQNMLIVQVFQDEWALYPPFAIVEQYWKSGIITDYNFSPELCLSFFLFMEEKDFPKDFRIRVSKNLTINAEWISTHLYECGRQWEALFRMLEKNGYQDIPMKFTGHMNTILSSKLIDVSNAQNIHERFVKIFSKFFPDRSSIDKEEVFYTPPEEYGLLEPAIFKNPFGEIQNESVFDNQHNARRASTVLSSLKYKDFL